MRPRGTPSSGLPGSTDQYATPTESNETAVNWRLRGSAENLARSAVNQSSPSIRPARMWRSSRPANSGKTSAVVTAETESPLSAAKCFTRAVRARRSGDEERDAEGVKKRGLTMPIAEDLRATETTGGRPVPAALPHTS